MVELHRGRWKSAVEEEYLYVHFLHCWGKDGELRRWGGIFTMDFTNYCWEEGGKSADEGETFHIDVLQLLLGDKGTAADSGDTVLT